MTWLERKYTFLLKEGKNTVEEKRRKGKEKNTVSHRGRAVTLSNIE